MSPTPEELVASPWFSEWTRVAKPIQQDGIDWMRSRPESVKAVMRVLPPSCVVRALNVACDGSATWRCACGWSGLVSGLSTMPDGSRVCPKDCGSGVLSLDWNGWERGLRLGIVSSIFEDGTITVRESPTADVRHRAHRECVEIVGYFNGLTPEKMAEILA